MPIHPLAGHRDIRSRLGTAVAGDRLPQVLLFVGPEGVGKQRLALWLAQRVVCEQPDGEEPCGKCRTCGLVLNLAHPDVHWFIPIPRPKAGDPDKQVEEAAEAVAEILEERRKRPLWSPPDGMAIHGVATARLVSRRVALTPVEARRKVLIIGHAERLVPQESSPEAANALLKVLEEPPADTIVVLCTAEPERVLPTIRSRAVPVRIGRLSDEEVRSFLVEALEPPPAGSELSRRVTQAEGAIGRAVSEDGAAAKARDAAERLLDAVASGEASRLEACLAQPPFQARGEFTAMLDALAVALGDAARETTGLAPRRTVPAALRRQGDPARMAQAIERVQEARELAQGNLNPQLLLASLSLELREAL